MIKLMNCSSDEFRTVFKAMGQYDYPVTQYLCENVDWDMVFSSLVSYKDVWNDRVMRFVKSQIISKGFQQFSNNKLLYVDDIGCDFIIPELDNLRLELKCGQKLFQWNARTTIPIKMRNTNNQSSHDKVIEQKCDYVLLVEPENIGIVPWSKVEPHLASVGDGFIAQIPLDDIEMVQYLQTVEDLNIILNDRFEEMTKKALEDIKNGVLAARARKEKLKSLMEAPVSCGNRGYKVV